MILFAEENLTIKSYFTLKLSKVICWKPAFINTKDVVFVVRKNTQLLRVGLKLLDDLFSLRNLYTYIYFG
jgi:hypothetical protein